MRERMKKKKNIIIGGLLAVVFLLSVGYAAFATSLNISGTANTSSWIIKITNIREKTHTGGADTVSTSFTDLSASFSSTLTQPGDSITYEVTVQNQGNIDASLKKVTKTFTQNKYIDVTYSGLLEGQMLYKQGGAGSTAVMEVTVTFKDVEIESLTETITSNITISLDFEQEGNNVDPTKKYLIEYDSQGGTAIESKYFGWEDQRINDVEEPKKLGYDFVAWFTGTQASGDRVFANTKISDLINDETDESKTLYAHWTSKTYLITYDSQGGKDCSSIGYSWEAHINILCTTTWKGYTFDGWYTEPNGGGLKIEYDSVVSDVVQSIYGKNTDVAGGQNGLEIPLYANWIAKKYTIKYDTQGGNEIPNRIVEYSDIVPLPEQPTKEGYTFDGWWTKASAGKQVDGNTMYKNYVLNDSNSKPLTIYAHWIENQ